ncbi:nucleotidyltransferase domain-containing protein [bacterium]|nr:nucleotidyltransferase domain-containing protein [bacterium]
MAIDNQEIWQQKKRLAVKACEFLLKHVKTIRGIALTGSVAYGDVKEDDDLDFLIITREGRVYTTRLQCYLWAMIRGKKRRKNHEKDSWCLNMFLDEQALLVPKSKRTAFAARQIERISILWEQDRAVQRFIEANKPWMNGEKLSETIINKPEIENWGDRWESWWRSWQWWYMKPKMTREVVNERQIFFQPLERE